jgi:hypothetical protein
MGAGEGMTTSLKVGAFIPQALGGGARRKVKGYSR